MITIFGIKFTSSEGLRKALNLWGSKWCAKVDIKDLLRMAFPELDDSDIKKNLIHFSENGIFKKSPVPPKAIYENYKTEFGCSLPFDFNDYVYEPVTIPVKTQPIQQPKVEVMNKQNDEYNQIWTSWSPRMTTSEIYKRLREQNGDTAQLVVAIEELSELIKEITKCLRNKGNIDHLAEEVADVEIMVEQVKLIFNVQDKVEAARQIKLQRLENGYR